MIETIIGKTGKKKERIYAANQQVRQPGRKTQLVKPLYWVALTFMIMLFVMSKFFANLSIRYPAPPVTRLMTKEPALIPGGLIVYADRQGHYRGRVEINNINAPFLIDTGATMVVVPERVAQQAGLQPGKPIQASTAGGQVIHHLTVIDTLKIGNAQILNVPAAINPFNDEILIGMSA